MTPDPPTNNLPGSENSAPPRYEAQGQRGSIDAVIKPIDPSMKLAGTA